MGNKQSTSEPVTDSRYFQTKNPFSLAVLGFLNPLLSIGSKRTLEHSDFGVIPEADRAEQQYKKFSVEWAKEEALAAQGGRPSLVRALRRTVGLHRWYLALFLQLLFAALSFAPPLILRRLIDHFEEREVLSDTRLWVFVSALLVLPAIASICTTASMKIMTLIGIHMKTALTVAVFRKAISMRVTASMTTGAIVTRMSVDAMQLQSFTQFANLLFIGPIQVIVSLWLIGEIVGVLATLAGLLFLICLMPVNGIAFGKLKVLRTKLLLLTDSRVKLVNELLAGIRVVKFYCWAKPLSQTLQDIRVQELKILRTIAFTLSVAFSLVLLSAPIILPVVVFGVYIADDDNDLTAAKAFSAIALFNIMRFPFAFLPMGIMSWIRARVSVTRIQELLMLPDWSPTPREDLDDGLALKLSAAQFTWPVITLSASSGGPPGRRGRGKPAGASSPPATAAAKPTPPVDKEPASEKSTPDAAAASPSNPKAPSGPTLSNVTFSVQSQELIAIVGRVGSGKSTLLSGLLGECPVTSGSIAWNKNIGEGIAYVSQQPWVLNDTVRANIVFGDEMDEERYNTVIDAVSFRQDLDSFEDGDLTQIGERGITLSGGQRARVSLARALYSRTSVVLLDDVLSAVDVGVGKHLFEHCITKGFADRTRILVTNQLQYVSGCDRVLIVDEGTVVAAGTLTELQASGEWERVSAAVKDIESDSESSDGSDDEDQDTAPTSSAPKDPLPSDAAAAAAPTATSDVSLGVDGEGEGEGEGESKKEEVAIRRLSSSKKHRHHHHHHKGSKHKKKEAAAVAAMTTPYPGAAAKQGKANEETVNTGSVSGSTVKYYMSAGGFGLWALMLSFQTLARGMQLAGPFWIAEWSKEERRDPSFDVGFYMGIYAVIGITGVIFTTVRGLLIACLRVRASAKIHHNLAESVLSAPMSFFDTTPIGRIINRFSRDVDVVDSELSSTISQFLNTLSNVIGAILAITIATNGTFLIPLIPLAYVYHYTQARFRRSRTAIQRIESVSRSPIFSSFSECVQGVSVLRAYHHGQRFVLQNNTFVDNNNVSYTLGQYVSGWLALRLDLLGATVSFMIAALAAASGDFLEAAWVGVGLAFSLEFCNFMKHMVRMMAQSEVQLNALERIKEYTDDLDSEAPAVLDRPAGWPADDVWPSAGAMQVTDLRCRYRDGPVVLDGLNFSVKGGEKIGIAGRTGSGKSSLMTCLFRLLEFEGVIEIDGVNISKLGLDDLRSNLTIIPQDPVLLSTSLRMNLDPTGRYAGRDDELIAALERVHLSKYGLDHEVSEGGKEFSTGERQLVCIARALLRKPRLLVMDEATASIDQATDELLQRMIREEFREATVLTIAHRLNTIMDSDRVLVLDAGHVAEFDTPTVLLGNPESEFAKLVEAAERAEAEGEERQRVQTEEAKAAE